MQPLPLDVSKERVGGQGYYYYYKPRSFASYKRSRSRSKRRKQGQSSRGSKSGAKHDLLTVASYLYRKTGKSWFVGPRGIYLSVPSGVRAEPAAMQLVADIPEVRGIIHYQPAQNQLYIPSSAAKTLAKRLTMRDTSISEYCRKIGAPHEQRFFGRPYACDPWLARYGRFGGMANQFYPTFIR